jgi:hypothetical protein
MAFQKTKFKISIKELAIEFEGDRESGQEIQNGVQQSILGLIGAHGDVLAIAPTAKPIDTPIDVSTPAGRPRLRKRDIHGQSGSPSKTETSNGEQSQSRTRRSKANSPGSLIQALITEGYFSEHRSIGDVLRALEHKGHNFNQTNLSSPLLELTRRNKLSRKKNEKGLGYTRRGPHERRGTQDATSEFVRRGRERLQSGSKGEAAESIFGRI